MIQSTKKYLFITFAFVVYSASFAQKQIEYKADKIKFVKGYKGGAKRLIGHVQFIHDNMVMTCDSSYFLDNNTLEAYSNIVIRQGDSLTITGNNARYDGNTKMGLIEGAPVVCTEKDMTLTTTVLIFDSKNSLASYVNGGTIVSKENTLTSKHGYYHSPTKTVSFRYDVKLTNPEYSMVADTLKYVTSTKTALFVGPTTITSKKDVLYCEQGWYNTQSQISHLTKNAVIYSGKNILHADSIHYDKKKETGDAFRHIQLIDNQEKVIISGDRAFSNQKKGRTWVTGHTLLTKFLKKDTLFASADTMWAIEKKIPVVRDKLGTDTDSAKYQDSTIVKAYHHVKIFKTDVQGIADSMIYSAYDSTVTLNHLPMIWSKQNQLSGKKIILYLANNKIGRIQIPENTFIAEKIDSLHFNQVKGKELWAYFKNDTLKKIEITGNAQAVYYLKNDKNRLQGANTIESAHLRILSVSEDMNQVTFIKKPKAKVIPIKDVNPKELELKGFSWQIERKPKSKEDLVK
jgi:lipopolysaccharide export system protein LptA